MSEARARRARRFALALSCASALGCLDEAPTYPAPTQIPPFVLASRVTPPLGAIYEGPIPFTINVPFRSEDLNTSLEARLYRDLVPGLPRRRAEEQAIIAAGIFEDDTRSVSMDWTLPLEGCHSLTLILTYAGNFDDSSPDEDDDMEPSGSGLPLDDTRAARVVWWMNVGEEAAETTLTSCPRPGQNDLQE